MVFMWMRKFLARLWRIVRLGLLLILVLFIAQRSTIRLNDRWNAITFQVSPYQFDYISWELSALAAKAGQTLWGLHPFMSETERSEFVRDYMTDLSHVRTLESQINMIYVDPDIPDPDAESAGLRAERDSVRDSLRQRQSLAEAILEGQVAAVLVDEGFGIAGQLFPPLSMRFTQPPNVLIVSPRDSISFDISISLNPLPVDDIAALEAAVDARHDVSSLIVPIGGMALYPAMILEFPSVEWAVETFAHEWLHHYLFFYPLGIYYLTSGEGFSGETRIINETTADVFGKALKQKILARYYPGLVTSQSVHNAAPIKPSFQEDVFDYGATMHETRTTVDQLLADGKVEEAEAYMEQQRQIFVANGYSIRKLNQAYFAFYGGYQGDSRPGIGGEDPIGPAVRDILDNSPSLFDFVVTMRDITTREQLLAARDAVTAGTLN